MSKFKVGDAVVLVNADSYSDIMRQLVGVSLVVRTVDNDRCGCEVVCAGVPGEEGWFLRSDDLQLVPVPTTAKKPKPLRRGDLVLYREQLGIIHNIDSDGYWVAALTGDGCCVHKNAKDLMRIGSVRKKIKRIKKGMKGEK
mgnify:FL=1